MPATVPRHPEPSRVQPQPGEWLRRFSARPWGPHDVELQHLLNRMRGAPVAGKLALICTVPYREWRLIRLPQRRGLPTETLPQTFTSLAEAECAAFGIRLAELAGAP